LDLLMEKLTGIYLAIPKAIHLAIPKAIPKVITRD